MILRYKVFTKGIQCLLKVPSFRLDKIICHSYYFNFKQIAQSKKKKTILCYIKEVTEH